MAAPRGPVVSIVLPSDHSSRERDMTDQEKLSPIASTQEHRQHNASPSQKTAMPRWRSKGKEKSTMQLACTWVVEHQIGMSYLHQGLGP